MSSIFFLGLKFYRAPAARGMRVVRRIAVLGVIIGVATLFLTQSVLSGFQKIFQKSILGFNAHLIVSKSLEISDPAAEIDKLQAILGPALKGATPFLYREALWVAHGRVKGAALKGIAPLTFAQVYDVSVEPLPGGQLSANIKDLLEDREEIPPVILGADLAQDLGINRSGDLIKAFLPKEDSGMALQQDSFQVFRAVGVFKTGLYEFDDGFVLTDLKVLQGLAGKGAAATGIELSLMDPLQAPDWAEAIKAQGGPLYDVMTWQDLNGPLFSALRLERIVFFLIISMVVAVATFNIVGVLLLMILSKSREISILRAMGLSLRRVKAVFVLQGLTIGLVGSSWGVILGLSVGILLKHSGIFKLAKEVYLVEALPIEFSYFLLASVVGVTLVITWLASQLALSRLSKMPLDL